mmetsp:Transcript_88150/g.234388  ORF Transcript_88150/g.234388 Transcript_88150/m.234388 type:complete len:293 (+) Transcript_88150:2837-3715(+)
MVEHALLRVERHKVQQAVAVTVLEVDDRAAAEVDPAPPVLLALHHELLVHLLALQLLVHQFVHAPEHQLEHRHVALACGEGEEVAAEVGHVGVGLGVEQAVALEVVAARPAVLQRVRAGEPPPVPRAEEEPRGAQAHQARAPPGIAGVHVLAVLFQHPLHALVVARRHQGEDHGLPLVHAHAHVVHDVPELRLVESEQGAEKCASRILQRDDLVQDLAVARRRLWFFILWWVFQSRSVLFTVFFVNVVSHSRAVVFAKRLEHFFRVLLYVFLDGQPNAVAYVVQPLWLETNH